MNANKKKRLIKRLEMLSGLSFEIKQLKRRIIDNPDDVARRNLAEAENEYNLLAGGIGRIESPRKREILRMRYIDNATWKAIAYEFYGHEPDFSNSIDRYLRRCYDARNSALAELDRYLSEKAH